MAQTETQAAAAQEETTAATTDATENKETTETTETAAATDNAAEETEDISYQAVEKDGQVTAIWEMQGRKHLRTIDPRSSEGKNILSLFTAEHHDEA